MTKVAAIIPARGGSKGIKRKNLTKFGGESLLARAIRQAKESKLIDTVYVNTDDDEIAEEGKANNAVLVRRPSDLASDIAEVDPLLVWMLSQMKEEDRPDILVLLYCTAPLREVADIDATILLVLDDEYDSALTLVEDHSYMWRRDEDQFVPVNYIPKKRAARQTEGWNQYLENKAVYVIRVKDILESGCRLNGRIGAHIMPATRSIDIDDVKDLALAANLAGVNYETFDGVAG